MDESSIPQHVDPTENCPPGFRLYEENGIKACGRSETTIGYCQAAVFPASHISYTEVCGRMNGTSMVDQD